MYRFILPLLTIFLIGSCSGDSEQEEVPVPSLSSPVPAPLPQKGCKSCHDMVLDKSHTFECTTCHGGSNDASVKATAHADLISQPAHPDNMLKVCGQCHRDQVEDTAHSLHFTLKNEVNSVRRAFGATKNLDSLTDIPVAVTPGTPLELADDLLRRRCLRCHPYYTGDRYPAIVRGTGCASCHLEFYEGKLVSHTFMKTPGDSQCLQCHYGNWVGYDYYGRYEHDMNDEYRTPYTTRYDYFRPFGVEFHQLSPDIHQQKGMVCVDCHGGSELMSDNNEAIACADCHDRGSVEQQLARPDINISKTKTGYTLLSAGDGKEHSIPLMTHPAHDLYGDTAGCMVCHAQWSFKDSGTHLMRNDLDEYDDFSRLSVQGSFEIEQILKNNLDFNADEMPHTMTDKISGDIKNGLWYKGFETRRWEDVVIGRDKSGRLQVMRPLLDIHLSWIDEDENVRFDSIGSNAENNGLTPYVPHTTGKAGMFYNKRINDYLRLEEEATR